MNLKIFISHCHKDYQDYTEELLNKIGGIPKVDILIDLSNIRPSESIGDNIDSMINSADIVVVVLTENSIQSNYVISELIKSKDRRKKIILLIDERINKNDLPHFLRDEKLYIQFNSINFSKKLDELIDSIRKYSIDLNPWLNYLIFNLSEYRCIVLILIAFGLLISCNFGAGLWWGINKIFKWAILALGTRITGIPNEPSLNIILKGYLPLIWAPIANCGIFATVILLTKIRFKTFWLNINEFLRLTFLLIIFFTIGATIFYNSGIDQCLKKSIIEIKYVELLSTMIWSLVLSLFTVIPILFLRFKIFNYIDKKSLSWCIVTTLTFSLFFLFIYFIFCPTNDDLRSIIVGTGMRIGLFIGLYYNFIRGPLKVKYKANA